MDKVIWLIIVATTIVILPVILSIYLSRGYMETKQAIKLLVEKGFDIVIKNVHCYKSKTGKYIIIHFNKDGDWQRNKDKEFNKLDDATEVYCSLLTED
jgi:hypothetical protein